MAIVSKFAGNAAPVFSSTSAAPGTGPSDAPVQALALRDGNVSIRQLVDLYMAVYSGRDLSWRVYAYRLRLFPALAPPASTWGACSRATRKSLDLSQHSIH